MKRRDFLTAGIGCALLGSFAWGRSGEKQKPARVYMFKLAVFGTTVHILFREDTPSATVRRTRMAAARFLMETHSRFTLFEESPLHNLNGQGAKAPQIVHRDIVELTRIGIEFSRATEGYFDPTIGTLTNLFRGGKSPKTERVKGVLSGVGVQNVSLQGDQIAFTHPETALDFNGLVKGWAVDRLADILIRNEVEHFLINAGGDIRARGNQGNVDGWIVHLEHPLPGGPPLHQFLLRNEAIATSGNTKQPHLHLLNTRTGRHANKLTSATAVAKTAAEADALSTAAFVGGLDWSRSMGRRYQLFLADKSLEVIKI